MPCCDATHNHVVNSVSSQHEYTYTVKVDNHELPHKQDTIFSLNEFNQIYHLQETVNHSNCILITKQN